MLGGKKSNVGVSFYEPTVLADATNQMSVSQEETFGPVAPVIRYFDELELFIHIDINIAIYCRFQLTFH